MIICVTQEEENSDCLWRFIVPGKEKDRGRKGKSNRDRCGVLQDVGTGPLCILPGLKGQSLSFRGISSSKDIASVAIKGIELDIVIKVHIYGERAREKENTGFLLMSMENIFPGPPGIFSRMIKAGRGPAPST